MDDQNGGNEKGKSKAEQSSDEQKGTEQDQSDLASRVVDSARGLFRDAVGSGFDATRTLSSSSTFGSKATSHGAANVTSEIVDDIQTQGRTQKSVGESSSRTSQTGESFRTLDPTNEIAQHFDQFASDKPVFDVELGQVTQPNEFETQWKSASKLSGPAANPSSQVSDQDCYDDGAEVRALLNDPNFSADDSALTFGQSDEPSQQTVDDLFAQDFSAEEQQAVNQFTSSLPQPPVHRVTPSNHPLALVPRSEEENRAIEQNIHGILSGTFTGDHLSINFESESQRNEWLSSWTAVLDRYTDEVWGDMLPVVRETREQLKEAKTGEATIDNKAVARLKMILGHLEQHRF